MISLRFAGGKELADTLRKMPERVSRPVQRQALRAAAEPMRQDMRTLAPHEPGAPDLRDEMTVSNVASGTDEVYESEVAIAVGPSKVGWYGFFQEFGTVHHGAQPFARPAFDQNVMKSLGIISAALWAAIAKKRGAVTGIRTSESFV